MFSIVSVCQPDYSKIYTGKMFMKFCGTVVHNTGINRLDFEGKRSKSLLLITSFKIVVDSPDKNKA